MLRLPTFEYLAPDSVAGVLDVLAEHKGQARLLAGGTDLLPNLKHGIEEAGVVVSLRDVPDLVGVGEADDGGLVIGAGTTLEALAADPLVGARYPSLAAAAGQVAGPHHRRMGTVGGNVCLNTRCVYINQTHFWREALGYCLKKDGTACHVVKRGKRCVAAASNDTAPPLMMFDARLVLMSRERGRREVAVADFYVLDGVHNKVIEPDELLVSVHVPPPPPGSHSAYAKLRPRNSIDFPRLSVAVAYQLDGGVIGSLKVVVSALAARPLVLRKVDELAAGKAPSDELFAAVGAEARKQCHPLTNIDGDPTYRRDMVPVYVRRALVAARDAGASQLAS